VKTATGKGGACWLARDAEDISLLDIYRAVATRRKPLDPSLHEQKVCLVSCNIKLALEKAWLKPRGDGGEPGSDKLVGHRSRLKRP